MTRTAAPSISPLDLTPADAKAAVTEWVRKQGLPAYRVAQIHRRLWLAPVKSWQDATELPGALRTQLDAAFPLYGLTAETTQQSSDGTRKYLWRLADGEAIESVLIPSGSRLTLCISSQAGCALGCVFCATGLMGFRRNLTAWEIAGQVRQIILGNPAEKPTNIVFMGMGEPLLNWPAVDTALTILNDAEGLGIGARHITVSTVGIIPGMLALAGRPEQFRLAISLHAPAQGQLGQAGGEGAEGRGGGGRVRRHTRPRISSRGNPWRTICVRRPSRGGSDGSLSRSAAPEAARARPAAASGRLLPARWTWRCWRRP